MTVFGDYITSQSHRVFNLETQRSLDTLPDSSERADGGVSLALALLEPTNHNKNGDTGASCHTLYSSECFPV